MRKIFTLVLSAMFVTLVAAAPALATNTNVCDPMDSGKIDVDGPSSFSVTAPDGYLIDAVCVKAGSANQGLGPEVTTVDPPQSTVTISHSSGKDISHWSASYTPAPSTTTTSSTLPGSTTTTTAPPATTTTTVVDNPTTTTSVPAPECDPSSPLWNETTQTCELPFTGVSSAAIGGLGLLLAMVGGITVLYAYRQSELNRTQRWDAVYAWFDAFDRR